MHLKLYLFLLTAITALATPSSYQQLRKGWFGGPIKVGNLPIAYIEISGLATPRIPANKGYVWVIEDGINPHIIAINRTTAANAGKWVLTGAAVTDVEECSSVLRNGTAYVYLFDTGDNASARSTFKVFRIKEPTITGANGTLAVGTNYEEIVCQFPAGNMPSLKDVEGAFADPLTGDVFFITKRITPVLCYKLPWAASYTGTQTLTYMGALTANATFNTISNTPTGNNGYCTGATISPNGTEILLRSYDKVARFTRNPSTQNAYQALTGTPTFIPCAADPVGGGTKAVQTNSEPQGEAICFDPSGTYYFTASEHNTTHGGNASNYPLFRFPRVLSALTTRSFQDGVSSYTGTLDTFVDSAIPTTSNAVATSVVADWNYSTYPTVSGDRHGLLSFNLTSIPTTSTVVQAYINLYVSVEGLGFSLHKNLVAWTEASTYTSLTAGMTANNIDANTIGDAYFGPTPIGQGLDAYVGFVHVNLPIATVQGWVTTPASNFGWTIYGPNEATGDGVQIATREAATVAQRPRLVVITTP